ncbi:MAG: AAA family ATPase [Desulfuromonadaceae bacterium]
MTKDELLSRVTQQYLATRDYNGLPVRSLTREHPETQVKGMLSTLLAEGLISLVYGDYHPNPHIKAFPPEPISEQIQKLEGKYFRQSCVYPSALHLDQVVDKNKYQGRPFELLLALGEAQLTHRAFDLSILEFYRNDPRYHYDNDDIRGYISIRDSYYDNGKMKKSDEILLESYGFCYDDDFNVYVATFVRYLSRLSLEHQQIWQSKLINEKTGLHPDFFRTAILGDWPERLSLFAAVLKEMQTINELSETIGREPFFSQDFREDRRPREFGYLIRPTLKEFNDFIHLLDKMISENINRKFFQDEVPYETEELRPDGKILVKQKGTIKILEDWLRTSFRTNDWTEIDKMLVLFRKIRNMRQKPAHAIKENEFRQEYIKEQRELMHSVYRSLKTLRLILGLHPLAAEVEISQHLRDGLIWSM